MSDTVIAGDLVDGEGLELILARGYLLGHLLQPSVPVSRLVLALHEGSAMACEPSSSFMGMWG